MESAKIKSSIDVAKLVVTPPTTSPVTPLTSIPTTSNNPPVDHTLTPRSVRRSTRLTRTPSKNAPKTPSRKDSKTVLPVPSETQKEETSSSSSSSATQVPPSTDSMDVTQDSSSQQTNSNLSTIESIPSESVTPTEGSSSPTSSPSQQTTTTNFPQVPQPAFDLSWIGDKSKEKKEKKQNQLKALNSRLNLLIQDAQRINQNLDRKLTESEEKIKSLNKTHLVKDKIIASLKEESEKERNEYLESKARLDRAEREKMEIEAKIRGEVCAEEQRRLEAEKKLAEVSKELEERRKEVVQARAQLSAFEPIRLMYHKVSEESISEKKKLENVIKELQENVTKLSGELLEEKTRSYALGKQIKGVSGHELELQLRSELSKEMLEKVKEVKKDYDKKLEVEQNEMIKKFEDKTREMLENTRTLKESKETAEKETIKLNEYSRKLEQERTGLKLKLQQEERNHTEVAEKYKAVQQELDAVIVMFDSTKRDLKDTKSKLQFLEDKDIEFSDKLSKTLVELEMEKKAYLDLSINSTKQISELQQTIAELESELEETTKGLFEEIDNYTCIVEVAEKWQAVSSAERPKKRTRGDETTPQPTTRSALKQSGLITPTPGKKWIRPYIPLSQRRSLTSTPANIPSITPNPITSVPPNHNHNNNNNQNNNNNNNNTPFFEATSTHIPITPNDYLFKTPEVKPETSSIESSPGSSDNDAESVRKDIGETPIKTTTTPATPSANKSAFKFRTPHVSTPYPKAVKFDDFDSFEEDDDDDEEEGEEEIEIAEEDLYQADENSVPKDKVVECCVM